jgi:hypothetical protein
MRINYLITAYNEPGLLKRTVGRLRHDDAFFYIHIDKRTDDAPFKEMITGPDVVFLDGGSRMVSQWGDISTCDVILALMKRCVADMKNLPGEGAEGYCVIMSGQDYPIKTAGQIHRFFSANYPAEYIHFDTLETCSSRIKRIMEQHTRYHWVTIRDKFKIVVAPYSHIRPSGAFTPDCNIASIIKALKNLPRILALFFRRRRYPQSVKCHASETWFEVTARSVIYILDFLKEHPDVYEYHKTVGLPEETLFQSILLSRLDTAAEVKDCLVYINREWPGREGVLDIENSDMETIKDVIDSNKYLLIRKLSLKSLQLLDFVDDYIDKNR